MVDLSRGSATAKVAIDQFMKHEKGSPWAALHEEFRARQGERSQNCQNAGGLRFGQPVLVGIDLD